LEERLYTHKAMHAVTNLDEPSVTRQGKTPEGRKSSLGVDVDGTVHKIATSLLQRLQIAPMAREGVGSRTRLVAVGHVSQKLLLSI
jgi:hypothetical protein